MRLCGISSRFQLLSPCMRQVTHALLTRPPLSHKFVTPKGSWISASFDLHVLSTPPAFILSQDQTLMFKFVIADVRFSVSEKSTVLKEPIFWLVVRQIFKICLNKFIRIFQGFSLFNFQCSSLTRCCLCYQRQLCYIIIIKISCQQLFFDFFLFS